ncbi:hypothetical protein LC653_00925, partial [Nostoc sp. CHAB 5784]|uniref:hypothetical protein n=1 Tax=Nostoc mirabile TaxID=2907820 RepID=UPI001E5539E8
LVLIETLQISSYFVANAPLIAVIGDELKFSEKRPAFDSTIGHSIGRIEFAATQAKSTSVD